MPSGAPTIRIPRWVQLVGVLLLGLLVWAIATKVGHAVFIFLTAALIALLLDPLVRALERVWIPRGFAVALVYLGFAAALVVAVIAVATVVVDRTQAASDRVEAYLTEENRRTGDTGAERDVDRLQGWLDDNGLSRIQIREQGREIVDEISRNDIQKYTSDIISFIEGAAVSIFTLLFSLVLLVVVSIYMLLDMPRLRRAVDRRFPPRGDGPPLVLALESALAGYVKGQLLLSLIIGTSAGLGLWLLGLFDWVPGADRYAVLFGVWVGVTELIPYLGPWLGAIPPFLYGLVVDPISALWVAILFLAIHQIEGHIVVPNVMGSALRLHPLLVIFGLLAGAELYGLPGVFVALPLLATARAAWEFFGDRVRFDRWTDAEVIPVVEVEVGQPPPTRPARPPVPPVEVEAEEPPAAAQR